MNPAKGSGFLGRQILNVVLVDEQVRLSLTGDTDQIRVIELDDAGNLFVIAEFDVDGRPVVDQTLQELDFFESLIGGFGFG